MIDLKAKPFYLNDEDIEWVETTLTSMSDKEKVAQLFCLLAYSSEEDYLMNCAETIQPGGLMCRPMNAEEIVKSTRILQEKSRIPMLLAANLERGGNGAALEGTSMGCQMAIGATGDPAMAAKLGEICGREGAALGLNWSLDRILRAIQGGGSVLGDASGR